MEHNPEQAFKDAHKDYYSGVDGPIGGDDRFKWVAETFFKDVRGKKILEIGCGEGTLLKMLRAQNEVFGVDISESGVSKTRLKGIECHHADASNERLPFDDASFDVAITLETIEHVENPHRMIWEIRRVLKKDAHLLISIPGEKVYHPFIYPGLFSRKSFSLFLAQCGLDIQSIKGWGQAPLMSHLHRKLRDGGSASKQIAAVIYYLGRKRNLLMRKWTGTPLSTAYCLNFWCKLRGQDLSRIEEVAHQTTPL